MISFYTALLVAACRDLALKDCRTAANAIFCLAFLGVMQGEKEKT